MPAHRVSVTVIMISATESMPGISRSRSSNRELSPVGSVMATLKAGPARRGTRPGLRLFSLACSSHGCRHTVNGSHAVTVTVLPRLVFNSVT
jgi:hypothetical protein